MTSTRKNQRGGSVTVENRKNHLIYTLKNTLNGNILSKILSTSSLSTNEKTKRERNVAFINVTKNKTGETEDFIKAVKSSPNATEILKSPIEYLSMIRNKFDGSFKSNPNTSSSLTESEKKEIFGNSNIGPKNPETDKYFLKNISEPPNIGKIILCLKPKKDTIFNGKNHYFPMKSVLLLYHN